MFFNEIDLLRIRYSCLKDIVDYIVVIESNQTFAGNYKPHILPSFQFDPGSSIAPAKVITISRSEFFHSFDDLVSQLRDNKVSDFSQDECSTLLSKVLDFPLDVRSLPSLYLDRFQRECCSVYINRFAADEDLILFSDADELPDNISDLCRQTSAFSDIVFSLRQHQFIYHPNLYEKTWFGSIFGSKKALLSNSLDFYRKKSGDLRLTTQVLNHYHGYHLTNMGGLEMVMNKIQNWGHQEYNCDYIISNLRSNILSGSDIFMRSHGSISKVVCLSEYYSPVYCAAINSSDLELADTLNYIAPNPFIRLVRRLLIKLCNLIRQN